MKMLILNIANKIKWIIIFIIYIKKMSILNLANKIKCIIIFITYRKKGKISFSSLNYHKSSIFVPKLFQTY